jgi:hypothetical protein
VSGARWVVDWTSRARRARCRLLSRSLLYYPHLVNRMCSFLVGPRHVFQTWARGPLTDGTLVQPALASSSLTCTLSK